MKNRLEEEYRQLKQSEAPDLWERIETGIDAEVDDKADGRKKTQIKKGSFFRKYSLPLVACIAALMCVPLMVTGFFRILSGNSKSFEAADTAPAENYATTTEEKDEFLPDAYEEEVCEEAICEDAAAEEEMKQESEKEQAIQELAQKLDAGQLIITITGFSAEEGILEEGLNVGTTYFVTTVEQGECSVFVPSDAVFLMELNQSVRIVVEPGDGSYDYLFVRMAD